MFWEAIIVQSEWKSMQNNSNFSLQSFYNQLLHTNKEKELLFQTLDDYWHKIQKENKQQLCKVYASQIYQILKEKGFSAFLCNTLDYCKNSKECCYEHIFVLATYQEKEKDAYVLIDPTFSQFEKEEGKTLNEKMLCFPSLLLEKESMMNPVVKNLNQKGYSEITLVGIQKYLGSINQFESFFSLSIEEILFPKQEQSKNKTSKL